MRLRTDHAQMTAATKAGLSRRDRGVASSYDPRPPSATKQRRTWRTRPDPLDGLWATGDRATSDGRPWACGPITLFDELVRRHPERVGPSFRRTLERTSGPLESPARHQPQRHLPANPAAGAHGTVRYSPTGMALVSSLVANRWNIGSTTSRWPFPASSMPRSLLGGESYAALASGLENALRPARRRSAGASHATSLSAGLP